MVASQSTYFEKKRKPKGAMRKRRARSDDKKNKHQKKPRWEALDE